ncbi:serine/threonine-protein kinase [Sphaerisporangium aureirubrum]|uniref:serine/threonine-protein kinase n=1 Tax=Sphaerisporangium aureirubrum TaxID=1544736 RepID=UPI0036421D1A
MPEQQPRLLADRYELVTPLGRGTMGTVWRAHDRLLDRDVAIKEIRQDSGLNKEQRAELRERMIREGRSAAKIAHPSVATVHDTIVVDGRPWIVMELVEARSLEQVIDEEGPLPPRLVAEIGLDLLGALGAAHEQGILHRDVKPGNVLLTETGRVVLTDFGIAKAEGDPNITKTGMVIGSPGYTAPERARGDHTGPESDMWSLGATLYFAVEGRPAYERRTVSETLAALMTEEAEPATQAGPLRPVLEALLHKDYTQRLTASQATSMLHTVARTPGKQAPPRPASPSPSRATTPAPSSSPPANAPSRPAAAPGPARPGPSTGPTGSPTAPPRPGPSARPTTPPRGGTPTAPTPATPGSAGTSGGRTSGAGTPGGGAPSAPPARTTQAGKLGRMSSPGSGVDAQTPPVTRPAAARADEEPTDVDPNQTITVIRPKGGLRIPSPTTSPPPVEDDDQPTMIGLPPITSAPPSAPAPGRAGPRPPAPTGPPSRPTTPGEPTPAPSGPPSRGGSLFQPSPPAGSPPRPQAPGVPPSASRPAPISAPPLRPHTPPPGGPRPTPGTSFTTPPRPAVPGAPPGIPFDAPTGPRPQPGPAQAAHPAAGPWTPSGAPEAGDAGQDTRTVRDAGGLGTDLFSFQGTATPRTSSPVGMIVLVIIALLGLGTIIMLAAAALSSSKSGATGPGSTPAASSPASGDASGPATATATVSDSAPASSGPGANAEPAQGLRRHTDSTGFVIDIPAKLQDVPRGRTVNFTADGDARSIRVSQSPNGSTDILATVRAAEARAIAAGTYPGYKRIRIAQTSPSPYTGTDVADWEFTYAAPNGQARVFSRWVAVPGGSSYAIYWSTPEADWPAHRPQLTSVLSSFRPARTDTPGGS